MSTHANRRPISRFFAPALLAALPMSCAPPEYDPASARACEPLPENPARTVYYVAIGEPGADNETCDGLAPTDEGDGRCPFRDLTSTRVRGVLANGPGGEFGTHSVTMALREGTYSVEPLELFEGEPFVSLYVRSLAESPEQAIVIRAYEGERVVLDGACASDHEFCTIPTAPGLNFQMINLFGDHVRVEGLEFANVARWNLTIEGAHVCVQDNTLYGPYDPDSDSIKSFDGSGPDVVVRGNVFTDNYEQAIDGTAAYGWLIEGNEFRDTYGKAVGFKFGAQDVLIRDNVFRELGLEAISLGGGGSDSRRSHEATRIVAEGNDIQDTTGRAVQVFSCEDCAFRDNYVRNTALGVVVEHVESGCKNGRGCDPSSVTIAGNRFVDLAGEEEEETPPNVFVAAEPEGVEALVADDNLYCLPEGSDEVFWLGGDDLLDFDGWKAASGTDSGSRVLASADPECAAPSP